MVFNLGKSLVSLGETPSLFFSYLVFKVLSGFVTRLNNTVLATAIKVKYLLKYDCFKAVKICAKLNYVTTNASWLVLC